MSWVLKENDVEVIKTLNWSPRTFAKHTNTSFRDQVPQDWTWEHNNFWLGWVEDIIPEPVPETPEQITARLEQALDEYIDSQARLFRYESIRTMVTYVNDPNPQFAAEGLAAVNFRSYCYTLALMIISEVQQGRPVPTEAELIAEMPKLEAFISY